MIAMVGIKTCPSTSPSPGEALSCPGARLAHKATSNVSTLVLIKISKYFSESEIVRPHYFGEKNNELPRISKNLIKRQFCKHITYLIFVFIFIRHECQRGNTLKILVFKKVFKKLWFIFLVSTYYDSQDQCSSPWNIFWESIYLY